MDLNNTEGVVSEEATIITFLLIVLAKLLPYMQDISYLAATSLACLTIFLNRKKYWEEFKKTIIYKWIKNGKSKINRRSP